MKKIIFAMLLGIMATAAMAQVPNFGTTCGHGNVYAYQTLKFRPGQNAMETYSTLQVGASDNFMGGFDYYTGAGGSRYLGLVARCGYKFNQYFKLGAQVTPSFDLNNNFDFGYLTSAIYMNGDITKDGRLFWVTDTWLENDKDKLTSAKQWTYLGYTIPLGGDHSITPMAGVIHDWKFEQDADLSMGAYYTYKNVNLYAWANDLLKDHPRVVLAVEFKFDWFRNK